ncbi:MAG: phenylalanine--tRNA ligase subunit beta [Nitrosopumilaceae archaeon]|nr:phenylalanine--tRNA ligase subunit beta [Nitrosopumilaceae archaeon]
MPVIELSYSRLQKLIGKVTKKQISDSLPFLGLDIESEDKDLVRIEYSPNRPDYSTDFGIALGLQGLLGIKTGAIKLTVKKSKNYSISVKSDVSKIRPFVTGIIAKNGKIDDKTIKQLMTMQEDLHFGIGRKRKKSSIGIHDLDKISFPLTYATASKNHKFIPLNSEKELSISEIIADTETGRDYGHLLGQSSQVPIIIDSNKKTVSFPPIINAGITTVTTKTKNLFVEVTGINKADAEDMLSVVATILQSAGFNLESVQISGAKNSSAKLQERKISVDSSLINQTLGLELNTSKIISSLKKSRLNAILKGKKIICTIPAYRFDIFGPMDLVEEVALGYGIQNFEPTVSPSQTIGQTNPVSLKLKSLNQTMIGLGFLEALNSSLSSKRVLYDMTNRDSKNIISVLDSKSQEHTILRDSILPGLIENLSRNIHESYPQKMFETGNVFNLDNPISEKINLAVISAHRDANFTEIKSVLQTLLKIGFGISTQTKTVTNPSFKDGHCASIIFNGNIIGIIGEIDSTIVENYKIRVPVVGFEISLSKSILASL